ncbi:MAG: DNA gyrase subunit B [Clostridia bacterium]|nr:DNA gyrase subunit B [Clostridia bacterium]
MMGKEQSYEAKDIQVLEGLDAVRTRPGMYIGTTGAKGMHHILWEIVDNGIDEVANGYGDSIEIEIYPDNSVSVKDNGRGIPVDIHPKKHIPAVELVFTTLHAGGKFGNGNYSFSGGLHGVGASVTNALSRWLKVEIVRGGQKHTMEFHSPEVDGKVLSGVVKSQLKSEPARGKETGTKVTFMPDDRVFGNERYSLDIITRHIRELAFLNGGMKISVTQHFEGGMPDIVNSFCYKGGLSDFVTYLNDGKQPKYKEPIYVEKKTDKFQVMLAMQHTDSYNENTFSYVNNIQTSEGGTHETGFKSALTKVLNDFGRSRNIIKDKQPNFLGEDFREGMTAVLAVKMQNVQFEGQTKTKLGNPEAKPMVENALCDVLRDALNAAKRDVIDGIFEKAAIAAKARENAAKAKDVARKLNSMTGSALIGKLSGCTGKKPELNELYIVEGDSAGGSAKQGRDRRFQAILPLRGKPLNAEKKRINEVLENEELNTLINALGTGFGKDFDISKLRYHKVVILADADQDGAHIRALLLSFFFRYMRELILEGHVYIGMPPLYKVEDKSGIRYAYDDVELQEILKDVSRNYNLQRYKGLGEMNPEQLWETTLSPEFRTLMRVNIESAAEAEQMVTMLMGDDSKSRKDYIFREANFNKQDTFKDIIG